MPAVKRYCHRAMLLERGEILTIDEPDTVADHYLRVNFPNETLAAAVSGDGDTDDQAAVILEGWFEEEHGERHEYLPQTRNCTFRALVKFNREVEDPSFTLMLTDDEGRNVFGTSTIWADEHTGRFEAGDTAVFGVSFENLLAPGRYFARVQVAQRGAGAIILDRNDNAATMVTTGTRPSAGVVELPHSVEVRRPEGIRTVAQAPAGEAR
jgi:hypothetical protein